MKRILGMILLVVLAAGQRCDTRNLPMPFSEGSDTGSDGGTGTNDGGNASTVPVGINALHDGSGYPVPEVGAPVSVQIVTESPSDANVLVRYLVGTVEVRHTALRMATGADSERIGPDLAAVVEISGTYSDGVALPSRNYALGQEFNSGDTIIYSIPDLSDACPEDSAKRYPGQCGCGQLDTDTDGDGAADCNDNCPADAGKVNPGLCDCGTPDTDGDSDGTPDCHDACPADAQKTAPGECGCGVPEGTCTPILTQACCMGSVDCLDMLPEDCASAYGTPQGTGTTCATMTCHIPVDPVKACCLGTTCSAMPISQCLAQEGIPQGSGTCSTASCSASATEACCLLDACTDTPLGTCSTYGGTPQGEGSSCATTPCLAVGTVQACCMGTSCIDMPSGDCARYGTPQGEGTTCATTICSGGPQACCIAGACSDMLPDQCLANYGTPEGFGSSCATTSCGMPWSPSVVYWSTYAGEIWAAPASNTAPIPVMLVSDESQVSSLQISLYDLSLYWINYGQVYRAYLDGTGISSVPFSPTGEPVKLAVDPMGARLVWTQFADPDGIQIYSSSLIGDNTPALLYSGNGVTMAGPLVVSNYPALSNILFSYPMTDGAYLGKIPPNYVPPAGYPAIVPNAQIIAVASGGADVYWVEMGYVASIKSFWIRRLSPTGVISTVLQQPEYISSLAVDPANGTLYWTLGDSGSIMWRSYDGTSSGTYMTGIQGLLDVAVGPAYLP